MESQKYIGNVLRHERCRQGIMVEDVCLGICSLKVYNKLESGTYNAYLHMKRALFQRLGLSAGKVGMYLGRNEYDEFYERLLILEAMNELKEGGNVTSVESMLVGYENAQTGNFTLANATEPQPSDVRTRISLVLRYQHKEQLRKLQEPYGYIGTWHTHPSATPSPSPVDLRDWEKCIRKNQNCTSALVFIIAGTETYRVWLCDSRSGKIIEGSLL